LERASAFDGTVVHPATTECLNLNVPKDRAPRWRVSWTGGQGQARKHLVRVFGLFVGAHMSQGTLLIGHTVNAPVVSRGPPTWMAWVRSPVEARLERLVGAEVAHHLEEERVAAAQRARHELVEAALVAHHLGSKARARTQSPMYLL
jgi:hypothetical protein